MAHKKLKMARRLSDDSFDAPAKRGRPNISEDLDAELDEEVEKELREFEKLKSSLLGSIMEVDSNPKGDTVLDASWDNQLQEDSEGEAGMLDRDVACLDTARVDSQNWNNTSKKGSKLILRQSLVPKQAKREWPKKSLPNANCGASAAELPSPKKGKCVVTQMTNLMPVPPVMARSEVSSQENPRRIATLLPRKGPALQGGAESEQQVPPLFKINPKTSLGNFVVEMPMLDSAWLQETTGTQFILTEQSILKSPRKPTRPNSHSLSKPGEPETLPVSARQESNGIQLILTEQGRLKSPCKLIRPNSQSPSVPGQPILKSPRKPTRPNSRSLSMPGEPETLPVSARQESNGIHLILTEQGRLKSPSKLTRPNSQSPSMPGQPETLPDSAWRQETTGTQFILTEQSILKSPRKLTRPNSQSPSMPGQPETLPVSAWHQETSGLQLILTEQGNLKSPRRPTRPNSQSLSMPGELETLPVSARQETNGIQIILTEQGSLKSPHRPTRSCSQSPSMPGQPETLPDSAWRQETTGTQFILTEQSILKSPHKPPRPNSRSILIPGKPERIIDITTDPPIEYCIVERALRWRFENRLDPQDVLQDLADAERPGIWCPELHHHVKLYETHTWLAACNELKRFFCWRCLFFSSQPTWYITSDKQDDDIAEEVTKHKASAVHDESVKLYLAWQKKKKVNVVNVLLGNNFVDGTWPDQSRAFVVLKGPPVSNNPSTKELFNQFPWLCSCPLGNIHCWPCLLFTKHPWKLNGNVESAHETLQQHATSSNHLEACLKLGKWEFDLKSMLQAKNNHHKLMRAFIRHLVEVILAENQKIDNDTISAEGLIGSIESLSNNSKTLKPLMDGITKNSKIPLDQIVERHLTVTLNTIERSLKRTILDEIESNAVSLIFDHSSSVSHKAVLSVIARYVDGNGQIHERFVKLLNVGYNTHSFSVLDEVLQIIVELQCRANLVGFAYDGYLVKPGDIPEFNAKVEKFCPDAKFFHYREHNFKTVVMQGLSHDTVCRRVVWVVTDLGTFFETTPSAREGLAEVGSQPSGDFWTSPDFILTVFQNHSTILNILTNICTNSDEWEVKVVLKAINFIDFLNDSTNRLFITLIAHILTAFDDLAKALDDDVGIEETKKISSCAILQIQKLGSFVNVVDSACSHLDPQTQEKTREVMMTLRDRFSNVIRMVVKLVKNRVFELDPGYFRVTQAPSNSYCIKLQNDVFLQNNALPSNFRTAQLARELQFFQNSSLTGSTPMDIVANLKNYNMIRTLPELFKFLQLALAVPRKFLGESAAPAVRRISAYVEGKNKVSSQHALIWMEKNTLAKLQEDEDFLDKATTHILTRTQNFVPGGKV